MSKLDLGPYDVREPRMRSRMLGSLLVAFAIEYKHWRRRWWTVPDNRRWEAEYNMQRLAARMAKEGLM